MYRLYVLFVLLMGTATVSVAQQPDAPVVVARLFMDVEGLEADFPDKARGWLPVFLEAYDGVQEAQHVIEALRNPDASPVKIALDSVYAVIEGALRQDLHLDVLPLDTLRGEVPYVFGYPMGNPSKVVRGGAFAGALAINVEVTVPDQVQSSYAFFGTGKVRVKGRPEMRLSVRLIDAAGRETWGEKVRVRAKEKIVLDEYWVLGIRKRTEVPEAGSLPALTREAAAALTQKVRAAHSASVTDTE